MCIVGICQTRIFRKKLRAKIKEICIDCEHKQKTEIAKEIVKATHELKRHQRYSDIERESLRVRINLYKQTHATAPLANETIPYTKKMRTGKINIRIDLIISGSYFERHPHSISYIVKNHLKSSHKSMIKNYVTASKKAEE